MSQAYLPRLARQQITARFYPRMFGEVLGDAVTPEIAAAWDEVYWLFATQLIAEEARLYQQAGVDPARPLLLASAGAGIADQV